MTIYFDEYVKTDDNDDDDDDDNCVIRTMMLMTTTSTSLNDFDLLGCMELSLSPAEMEKRSQERPKGQEMDKDTKGVQLEADFYFTYNLNSSVVGTMSFDEAKSVVSEIVYKTSSQGL